MVTIKAGLFDPTFSWRNEGRGSVVVCKIVVLSESPEPTILILQQMLNLLVLFSVNHQNILEFINTIIFASRIRRLLLLMIITNVHTDEIEILMTILLLTQCVICVYDVSMCGVCIWCIQNNNYYYDNSISSSNNIIHNNNNNATPFSCSWSIFEHIFG